MLRSFFPVAHCGISAKEAVKHLSDFCKLKIKMFYLDHYKVYNFNFKLFFLTSFSEECLCPINLSFQVFISKM